MRKILLGIGIIVCCLSLVAWESGWLENKVVDNLTIHGFIRILGPNRWIEFSKQCMPGTADTDTLRVYMRQKAGIENILGKDDGGYEFQIGGANRLLTEGCDISISSAVTPLEFGRGEWFNLLGGGQLNAGFQPTFPDERGRRIMIIADQNTVFQASAGLNNLDLGGCNLNLAAGRPHEFFSDGCKWHLIGHHNDF